MSKFKVGLVGCGVISDLYLNTLKKYDFVDVVACASLNLDESRAKAEKHNIPKACQPQDIYDDPNIQAVLNLTIPAAHAEVSLAAINAGKHVYSEKPFVTDFDEGKDILGRAARKNLLIGNAPDTFLGGRIQSCKRAIDNGLIGTPTGATVFAPTHGVERHHPNPDFYYKKGGGPLLDLGPYYLTALIALLGPVKRSCGMANRGFEERLIESQPRSGEFIEVEVDTHVSGLLEFQSGAVGMIMMSFDVWDSQTPRLEIYGTKGTLCIPDPDPVHGTNIFGGKAYYKTRETARWTYKPRVQGLEDWAEVENVHGFNDEARGLGLLDLAYAVRDNRPLRASGEMALHVFEIMEGILNSPSLGKFHELETTCAIPAPLPINFPNSEL